MHRRAFLTSVSGLAATGAALPAAASAPAGIRKTSRGFPSAGDLRQRRSWKQ